MAGRETKHGHHRVADELLDRCAMLREHSLHRVEVARHHVAERLRRGRPAVRGGGLGVGEDDRHRLAALMRLRPLGEGRTACPAVKEIDRVLLAADATDADACIGVSGVPAGLGCRTGNRHQPIGGHRLG